MPPTLGLGCGRLSFTPSPAYAHSSLVAHINPSIISSWTDGSQINDLSGHGNHVTQGTSSAQPLITDGAIQGRPAAHFDGGDWLTFGKNQLGNTRLYATSGDYFTVIVVGSFRNFGALIARASATAGTRNFQLYRNPASPYALIGTCRGSNTTLLSSTSGNTAFALAARWDGTNLRYFLMSEGSSTWTEINGTVGVGAEESGEHILLGARTSGAGNLLDGQLGEVLIYDTAISDAQMVAIGNYIGQNWLNRSIAGRIIVLGASVEFQSFDESVRGDIATERLIHQMYGRYVKVISKAVSGQYISGLDANVTTQLSTYNLESYPTYCPIHIGGNDVSDLRPYSNMTPLQISAFSDGILSILSKVSAKGFVPVLTDISFRNYGGTTISNEAMGALPFNTQLVRPLMSSTFVREDGTPLIELYDLFKNNYAAYLEADYIHPNAAGEAAWRQFMAGTLGNYLCTGQIPPSIAV